jgi:hypothetical protein
MAQDWPLANDHRRGIAFHPEGARKWRVRRIIKGKSGGPQEPLFDKRRRLPLEVEIDASPEELSNEIEAAGNSPNGEFYLVPVDDKGRKVGDTYGYVVLGDADASTEGADAGGGAALSAIDSSAIRGLTEAVHALLKRDEARDKWIVQRDEARDRWLTRIVETLAGTTNQLVRGYADVRPVGEELPAEQQEELPQQPPEPDMFQKMQQMMPFLMQAADWWRANMSGAPAATAPPPNGAANGVGLGIRPDGGGSSG